MRTGQSYHDAPLLAAMAGKRVLVLGDVIVDEYLLGTCSRLSPEAPVPVLVVQRTEQVLGGAGNTAANVAALGGRATLVALVGQDGAGETVRRCAIEAGVELHAVEHSRPTVRKIRVVAQRQQIVRLDHEVIGQTAPDVESRILTLVDEHVRMSDMVIVSDYAKGFVSADLCQQIIHRAHAAGVEVIIDPRPSHRDAYRGCDYLTPNWRECCALLDCPEQAPTAATITTMARALAQVFSCHVILTLGEHGILFSHRDGGEQFAVPAVSREVYDVSGAGDTVVASFGLARAAGADHRAAVTLANCAAGVVVTKFGTSVVSRAELSRELSRDSAAATSMAG